MTHRNDRYGVRNLRLAVNNQLIFMRTQRVSTMSHQNVCTYDESSECVHVSAYFPPMAMDAARLLLHCQCMLTIPNRTLITYMLSICTRKGRWEAAWNYNESKRQRNARSNPSILLVPGQRKPFNASRVLHGNPGCGRGMVDEPVKCNRKRRP